MIMAAGAAGWLTGLGAHGDYGSWVAPAALLNTIAVGAVVTALLFPRRP